MPEVRTHTHSAGEQTLPRQAMASKSCDTLHKGKGFLSGIALCHVGSLETAQD